MIAVNGQVIVSSLFSCQIAAASLFHHYMYALLSDVSRLFAA